MSNRRRIGEGEMSPSFGEVEAAFLNLRRKFRANEISRHEFIDQLKKLRLRDGQGRFWMIGAQSGRWYFFDGREWVQSVPPKEETPLDHHLQESPARDRAAETALPAEEVGPGLPRGNAVLRRLNPASFFAFSAGTGLILGIVIGAVFGSAGFVPELAKSLPDLLSTLHGTLMGGIVYAVLGGFLGFAVFGVIGFLEAHLFNAISSILGGFRLTLDRSAEGREEEKDSF